MSNLAFSFPFVPSIDITPIIDGSFLNFWESASNVFSNIWSFITSIISSIINFIAFISEGFSFFSIVTQFLPSLLSISVLTAIAIGVMKMLLGK